MLDGFFPKPSTQYSWKKWTLTGKDAPDFLQRLTTVDIPKIAPLTGSRGFLLNHRGQILSDFFLWRASDHDFTLEFSPGTDENWQRRLVDTIEQFHFGEDFTFQPKEEKGVWIFPKDSDLNALEWKTENELEFYHHGDQDFGKPWISVWGENSALTQWLDQRGLQLSQSPDFLTAARIEAIQPWIEGEIQDQTNPLEVGLPRGISRDKGCYPGQEVIERIYTYGEPPKRLVQIEFEQKAPLGHSVYESEGEKEIGQITSIHPESNRALAIVKKLHAKVGQKVSWEKGKNGEIQKISEY